MKLVIEIGNKQARRLAFNIIPYFTQAVNNQVCLITPFWIRICKSKE